MFAKNLLIPLSIIFMLHFSNAQQKKESFTLKWQNKSEISINNNKTLVIPLLENKAIDENLLPYYSKRWKISNNSTISSYTITNVIYKTISKNNYPALSQTAFPTKLQSSLFITNEREQAYIFFNLTPLIYNNGVLKKIISFDLKYTITPKTIFKNASSIHDSPLATGTWYKIAIETTGVYKMDKAFLQSIGISGNINPKNIQIYGNGGAMLPEKNSDFRYDGLQENAIFVEGEDDNQLNDNDFVLFYAKGPDSWINDVPNELAHHQRNVYSNQAYYFISVTNGPGKRIANQATVNNTPDTVINTFNDFKVWEKDILNLDNFGQEFFGENFSINNQQTFPFNFENIDTSKDVHIKLKAAAIAKTSGVPNPSFDLSINNTTIISLPVNSIGTSTTTIGSTKSKNASSAITTSAFDVVIDFNNQGVPATKGYLDYIEINATRNLMATDKQFSFRNYAVANNTTSSVNEYQIGNATAIYQVWDTTDFINPKLVLADSGSSDFVFREFGGSLREYTILNASNHYTPQKIGAVPNQNLHNITDIDYLIITDKELLSQANRLANYHQQHSNLSTLVLTEETIYNEFSSGSKDATAIRDFIHHLYTTASSANKKIKFVAFMGDSSYDFKNTEGHNLSINTIAFQSANSFSLTASYITDDFFGMMDANEGDFSSLTSSNGSYNSYTNGSGNMLDVAIGRLPVKNYEEATISVDKILSYYHKSALGDWRNTISLIADDVTRGKPAEIILVQQIEATADFIKANKPVYNLKKIYADAFVQQISAGGESYPDVKIAINNAVERGSLIIDYFGHGGENGWANERILDLIQINNWYNKSTLPLFITITCEFSRYDNPQRVTAGEDVFNNKDGGATAMITTAREVYIHIGGPFNIALMSDLLAYDSSDDNDTIAQSLAKTKNDNANETQRLFIQYFGDPAMKLAKPKPNVIITKMNDVDITTSLDTIKALSHVYFEGIVTQNNVLDSNFNGELSVTIYDKEVIRETLNNDNNTGNMILPFDTRESKIFNGKASIENGLWKFDFIAPRDIRIAYGTTKISFYAENQLIDKNGYNTDVIIGGINPDAPEDNIGPTIKLFMNDHSFIDGGNTNESPLFLAVLEDESGINTSLTAVDHDIIGILDGDQSNPIIMNDYYETELNDFKKGNVNYPFRNLAVGPHTISFKCWDTYNNPSEASLNFVVVSDEELVLDNVLNYPNPFINYTEFWFNHNKPNETLETQVQIFTISGKLIKTLNETTLSNSTLSRSITWDGLDDYGHKIGKGVYIYKLIVKVASTGLKTEKIEKLVILQ
ncbi:MAG: type IX secretion system sortase PorU [Flavobacteriaceae bacterium]